MASFTLGEILKAVSGVLLQQGSHEYCTGVNTCLLYTSDAADD